jgi:PAS domain-containing protein
MAESVSKDGLPLTFFAPPDRLCRKTIDKQHRKIRSNPLVLTMLESFPEPAAILNRERQIVHANDKMLELTGQVLKDVLGQRVGQALGCQHGEELPAGCGTTPACAQCGASRAIVRTNETRAQARDVCRMTLTPHRGRGSFDFDIRTTPLPMNGDGFMVFAVRDTSAEQRRLVLERMFFHDVLNAAGGLRNLLRIWPDLSPEQAGDLQPRLADLASKLVEEILAQRDLALAERGDLEPSPQPFEVEPMLQQLATLYGHHDAGEGKTIVLRVPKGRHRLVSDQVLLHRVLGNLLKNALEASIAGQVVTLTFSDVEGPTFTVHNETVMPGEVLVQVFRRSFSTKGGTGRGIGTYSARLITERYLGGRLTFTSKEGEGTTFSVTLPV